MGCGVVVQFYVFFVVDCGQGWQCLFGDIGMYQQCFYGVVWCVVLGFGVVGDVNCFVQVGGDIDVDVVDVVQVFDYWYFGFVVDVFDQVFVVVWDDYVDVFGYVDQCVDCGVVGGFYYLYGGGWQVGFGQVLLDVVGDCLVGVDCFGVVVQDGCVVGFQVQVGGVDGYVWL